MNTQLAASSALSVALGSALPLPAGAPDESGLWNDDGSARHWNDDLTPAVCPLTLKQCLAEMQAGIKDFQSAFDKTVTAALRIGHAALTAKELVPYGKFVDWLAENVTTMSGTWVRVCMRAAQVADLLEGRERRDAIIATAGTVEGVAALLPWLKEGHNPDTTPVPPVLPKGKTRGNPPKLVIDRSPDAGNDEEGSDTTDADAVALHSREQGLDARERTLEAREAALDAREKSLDERERNLAMREAMLRPADAPTDAKVKPSSMGKQPEGETIDDLKAKVKAKAAKEAEKLLARAKAAEAPPAKAKKAKRSPAAAAGSADQEGAATTPAQTEKTAPTQPDAADVPRETSAPATTGATPQPGVDEVL